MDGDVSPQNVTKEPPSGRKLGPCAKSMFKPKLHCLLGGVLRVHCGQRPLQNGRMLCWLHNFTHERYLNLAKRYLKSSLK